MIKAILVLASIIVYSFSIVFSGYIIFCISLDWGPATFLWNKIWSPGISDLLISSWVEDTHFFWNKTNVFSLHWFLTLLIFMLPLLVVMVLLHRWRITIVLSNPLLLILAAIVLHFYTMFLISPYNPFSWPTTFTHVYMLTLIWGVFVTFEILLIYKLNLHFPKNRSNSLREKS
jgi:hypothetical protein